MSIVSKRKSFTVAIVITVVVCTIINLLKSKNINNKVMHAECWKE